MTDKPTALQVTDAEANAVAIGPRVSLADIQEAISAEYSFVLGQALSELGCPNAELGAKFAKEDAVRQLWPLMGFALRDRLATRSTANP